MNTFTEPYTSDDVARHRAAWVARLREPTTLQAYGQLMAQATASAPRAYCCLGVAEDVRGCTWRHRHLVDAHNERYGPAVSFVPLYVPDEALPSDELDELLRNGEVNGGVMRPGTARWLGLADVNPWVVVPDELRTVSNRHGLPAVQQLSALNDTAKFPLTTIADVIEAQPPDWNGTHHWCSQHVASTHEE